jgi:curved DNA-binding protein
MEFRDYYKILDVEPTASDKEIKTSYRRLARKYHPDLNHHDGAEEQFKEVAEAYDVLKDKEKRAEFDEIRQYGAHGQSFEPPPGWQPGGAQGRSSQQTGDYSDFFSSIFGGAFDQSGFQQHSSRGTSNFVARGQDVETDLPVFLEDTLKQTSKPISIDLSGKPKKLNVKIPVGVANGERIRLKGQGAPGIGGGPSGDLYFRIRLVPHPLFDIEGHNLIVVLPLAPWEAALGAKVEVPTLTGKVRLTIPPNSQTGQRLRVKGRGLVKKPSGKGDLFAVIKVVMPENSNEEVRALWQQLVDKAAFEPRKEWSS